MAHSMTDSEWRRFLTDGTRTGKLSTVRADGSPHLAPVWFALDGSDIMFTTGRETVKGRNLLRDGRVALCVDDERPPFAFVVVWGRVEVSEDLPDMQLWATRIAARYMGPEKAEEYGARNAVPGELLVRVRPDRVIAQSAVAD